MLSKQLTNDFILVWNNGLISTLDASQLSHMLDLADCDAAEGVKAIYALNENKELVKIRLGDVSRDPDWHADSSTMVYATMQVFAGSKLVSHVHMTDHLQVSSRRVNFRARNHRPGRRSKRLPGPFHALGLYSSQDGFLPASGHDHRSAASSRYRTSAVGLPQSGEATEKHAERGTDPCQGITRRGKRFQPSTSTHPKGTT